MHWKIHPWKAITLLYERDEKLSVVGSLVPGGQFYGYCYTPQKAMSSLRLVFSNGSNVKNNGIRIESYKLSNLSSLEAVYVDENYRLYKNHENAGHIFIFENVKAINDVENFIVENKETINFTKDAYLNQEEKDVSLSDCEGTILSYEETNNALRTRVEISSDEVMLGFSESFLS